MSDETASSPENSPNPIPASAPRVRRISNPRPKKVAKKALPAEPDSPVVEEVFAAPASEREDHSDAPSQAGNDWPESEAESEGGSPTQAEFAKRKRRRRKGKGGQSAGPQNGGGPSNDEDHSPVAAEPKSSEAPQDHRPRQHPGSQPQQQPRPKIDPELLTKMAWKIYLAEVSEEGVALIGDNDAKDLSRRCFRLAEIFIEEQTRRR